MAAAARTVSGCSPCCSIPPLRTPRPRAADHERSEIESAHYALRHTLLGGTVSAQATGPGTGGAADLQDQGEFTTKPRRVQVMLSRVIEAGVPFAWFSADEIYGQPKYLQVVAKNAAPVPLLWTRVRWHNHVI
jgi:hypothetical protein